MAFVADIHRRLNPSGVALIATLSGPSYPRWAKWNTDLPPVQLQWLSEAGLTSVPRKAGFEVTPTCAVGLNAKPANAIFSATPGALSGASGLAHDPDAVGIGRLVTGVLGGSTYAKVVVGRNEVAHLAERAWGSNPVVTGWRWAASATWAWVREFVGGETGVSLV